MKKAFIFFSFLLLVYMMWPGPASIQSFGALPNSDKSILSGDTWQVPDVAGYFSGNYRNFAVPFYAEKYQKTSNFFFPPIRINHPPEFAFTAIKKHTDSTYLEELIYPLRDSLYVNGFEPFYEDGQPKFWGSTKFVQADKVWDTKVTLRFYSSSLGTRLLVWFGIILSVKFLYRATRRVI